VCGLCGCAIARKARLASEQCPAPHQERPGFTRWGEPRVENNERVQQGAATTSE
jgi:Zn ribbon nucleic-acid-binding protein